MSENQTKPERRGIYVAFDRDGNHFAYAKHPDDIRELPGIKDPDGEAAEQRRAIAGYRRQAKRKGGKVELLTPDEYQRRVIDTRPPA